MPKVRFPRPLWWAAVPFLCGLSLGGITFATDGGDRHVNLDRLKDGALRLQDLRLRLEFGGSAAAEKIEPPPSVEGWWEHRFGGLTVALAVPYAAFGPHRGQWQFTREQGVAALDLTLFHGPESTVKLADLAPAAVGLAVRLGPAAGDPGGAKAERDGERLRLAWNDLWLELPTRPAKVNELQASFRARP